MRDFGEQPYTREERRAADYIDACSRGTVAGGDDAIGFLIASHACLVEARQDRPDDIAPGDVVQLDPNKTENKAFAGCFLIVEEVKAWGVQGYVQDFGTREERGGQAYYRTNHGNFKKIGKAEWIIP